MRRRGLEVDAQQLLLATDDTELDGRRQHRVTMERGAHVVLAKKTLQRASLLVVPDDADQRHLRAKRSRVTRDIGRTTGAFLTARDFDDRYRRLRRDSLDLAEPVAIEHDVADDQHARARDRVAEFGKTMIARGHVKAAAIDDQCRSIPA